MEFKTELKKVELPENPLQTPVVQISMDELIDKDPELLTIQEQDEIILAMIQARTDWMRSLNEEKAKGGTRARSKKPAKSKKKTKIAKKMSDLGLGDLKF